MVQSVATAEWNYLNDRLVNLVRILFVIPVLMHRLVQSPYVSITKEQR